MPTAVISTELVHDAMPSTVPSTVSSPPHEFEDKSKETTITIENGHTTVAEGSVSDGISTTEAQPAPEKSSVFRPSNIEDMPVVNDPRQWSQRRKVGHKVTSGAVLVLIAVAARCTCHCSLYSPLRLPQALSSTNVRMPNHE